MAQAHDLHETQVGGIVLADSACIEHLPCCRYCATLGYVAGALIAEGQTGLMATASSLDRPCADWSVGGYPLIDMMCIERRRGK